MIKYIFILINFAGLFFINLFTDTEVLVDNQIPTNLVPGERKEVHITINKKDIQGFAKMELVLPPGFIATPGETQGASFTYTQQKARFVWMTLPTSENFDLTYYIECIEGMKGNYSVNGTFSYIRENKRVDYSIPQKTIIVGTGAAVANSQTQESESISASIDTTSLEATAASASTDPVSDNEKIVGTTVTVDTETEIATSEPIVNTIDLYCDRTIQKDGEGSYKVELVIHNNSIEGFAKILEVLPTECTAKVIQDGGAVITTEKNTIKFVWFEIPNSPEVHLAYQVSCASLPSIKGKLSFVKNSRPMELEITNAGSALDTEALVLDSTDGKGTEASSTQSNDSTLTENTTLDQTKQEKNSEVKDNKKPNTKEEKTAQTVASKNTQDSETIEKTDLSPEIGITYKVQILAAHRVVNKTYFQQKHSFGERFNIENHEGWVKYTTGKFTEYKEARDNRERIRKDYGTLPGPFVTAYNNGERITVQEALLITKQQWYN